MSMIYPTYIPFICYSKINSNALCYSKNAPEFLVYKKVSNPATYYLILRITCLKSGYTWLCSHYDRLHNITCGFNVTEITMNGTDYGWQLDTEASTDYTDVYEYIYTLNRGRWNDKTAELEVSLLVDFVACGDEASSAKETSFPSGTIVLGVEAIIAFRKTSNVIRSDKESINVSFSTGDVPSSFNYKKGGTFTVTVTDITTSYMVDISPKS